MAVPLFNLTSDLIVSRLCLGTMTFGEQNSLAQSFQLLDKAFHSRIRFRSGQKLRGEVRNISAVGFGSGKFPAIKLYLPLRQVSGPSGQMAWIRGGPGSLDAWNITEAIDGSLTRLQTDCIDLYQIHWPDRYVPMFGEIEYDPTRNFSSVSVEEQLSALQKAIGAGKIRYVGLSNETPYGLMKFLHAAERISIHVRIVSLQVLYDSQLYLKNCYNFLCRNFDSGLAECCSHERVCLLAYSPLAMGILSGKYLSLDGGPDDALNLFRGRYAEGESRYSLSNSTIKKATDLYVKIAKKYGIHPVSLAIAFVLRHPLVASAVFGATKLWQLQEVLDGCEVELIPEIVTEINRVHSAFPNPCP
ncbi:uncharacterized protein [Primulina huaijiensis]|uniref:uncharacterized protein isoform X2 n=1 Tax=Primulina huaijiensis TaxID=1492673 RepID=UPI003CC73D29